MYLFARSFEKSSKDLKKSCIIAQNGDYSFVIPSRLGLGIPRGLLVVSR